MPVDIQRCSLSWGFQMLYMSSPGNASVHRNLIFFNVILHRFWMNSFWTQSKRISTKLPVIEPMRIIDHFIMEKIIFSHAFREDCIICLWTLWFSAFYISTWKGTPFLLHSVSFVLITLSGCNFSIDFTTHLSGTKTSYYSDNPPSS